LSAKVLAKNKNIAYNINIRIRKEKFLPWAKPNTPGHEIEPPPLSGMRAKLSISGGIE